MTRSLTSICVVDFGLYLASPLVIWPEHLRHPTKLAKWAQKPELAERS
jgi:hypothetical protein